MSLTEHKDGTATLSVARYKVLLESTRELAALAELLTTLTSNQSLVAAGVGYQVRCVASRIKELASIQKAGLREDVVKTEELHRPPIDAGARWQQSDHGDHIHTEGEREMSATEKLLISDKEAAAMLGMGRSTLWREVKNGRGPAPIKIGGITRWRVADVRNFVANAPTISFTPA